MLGTLAVTLSACVSAPADAQQPLPTPRAASPAASGAGAIRLLVAPAEATPAQLLNGLTSEGCRAETLGVIQSGQWVMFIVGAPSAVNAGFPAALPTATPYLARCAPVAAAAPAGPALSDARLPTWGLFDAGWPPEATTVRDISTALGRPPGVMSWYVHAASKYPPGTASGPRWSDNVERVRAVHAAGQVPLITWEMLEDATPGSNPMSLRAIAAGEFDAYFDSWAEGVRSVAPNPVHLRIFHEMNLTGQYPWSVYRGDPYRNTPAQLSAAWRHIVDRFRLAGASNVRWVFNPGGDLTNNPLPPEAYPGNEYVDFIGLDVYDTAPRGSLALDYPLLAAIADKPWVMGEVGGTPAWVRDELAPFVRRRPMTIVWFNAGQWELEASRLAAVKAALEGLP